MYHEIMIAGILAGAVGGGAVGGIVGLIANSDNEEVVKQDPAVVLELNSSHEHAVRRFETLNKQGELIEVELGEKCIRLIQKYEIEEPDVQLAKVAQLGRAACGNTVTEVQESIKSYENSMDAVSDARREVRLKKAKLNSITHPKSEKDDTLAYAIGGAVVGALALGAAGAFFDRVFDF